MAASWLAVRLPERPLMAGADAAGELWYRLTPARAARARRNLGRVCVALAVRGEGTLAARRAATDPDALERLVRSAYRHVARYYVEVARTPLIDERFIEERLDILTPDAVDEWRAHEGSAILVGLHLGAIELPALFVARGMRTPVTAPMEVVDDPALQTWFARTRGLAGIRIVPLDAPRELTAALERGEAVGLVADRDITGSGTPVPFFGAAAPMPRGPALLAVSSGAPVWVGAVTRGPRGRYLGRLVRVPVPAEGSRRERVAALQATLAQTFESLIATSPEQWWACFHPVWPDLEERS